MIIIIWLRSFANSKRIITAIEQVLNAFSELICNVQLFATFNAFAELGQGFEIKGNGLYFISTGLFIYGSFSVISIISVVVIVVVDVVSGVFLSTCLFFSIFVCAFDFVSKATFWDSVNAKKIPYIEKKNKLIHEKQN